MFSIPSLKTVTRVGMAGFLILGLLVAGVAEWYSGKGATATRRINSIHYDIYKSLFIDGAVSSQVVIVDIDELALQIFGQWPWPRYKLAQLIQRISELGSGAIGLDVLMPEPDRTALSYIRDAYKRDFNLDLTFSGVPTSMLDNDALLGRVLRETSTVTAHYLYFDHQTPVNFCNLQSLKISGDVDTLQISVAPGLLCNTSKLRTDLNPTGFINMASDMDGISRRLPLFIEFQGEVYPSLALALSMQGLDHSLVTLERDQFGMIARLDGLRIPVETGGEMLLNYPGPKGMYTYISASKIFQGTVAEEEITGKIVLIGSSATGLYDFHQTVYDTNFPGVETLAVAIGSIVEQQYIRGASWARQLSVILSCISGIGMALLFTYGNRLAQVVLGTLLWLLFLAGLNVFSLSRYSVYLAIAPASVVTIMLFTIFSAIRYGLERRASFTWYRKLAKSQQATLESLAMVVETRDYETGGHIMRTQHFVKILAEELAERGLYRDMLTPAYIELLYISSPLHDIGKVGVPDKILTKPGKLTPLEFVEVQKHAGYGKQILQGRSEKGEEDDYLELAREVAFSHHEKWDGSGYPQGLSGQDIPLSGRIMALADVYDALTSDRCYKAAYNHEQTMRIIKQGSGSHFEPAVVEAFEARADDMHRISKVISEV